MTKPITVYWCTNATFENQGLFSLLDLEPKPVFNQIVVDTVKPPQSYRQCTGLKKGTENLFSINFPVDFDLEFSVGSPGQEIKVKGSNSEWVISRTNTYENSFAFDLDLSWLFFSEESLLMKQTPVYATKTVASSYGRPAVGAFDIGNWFRPVSPAWTLWQGVNRFVMPAYEPAMYLEYYTDKPIVFAPFAPTEELRSIWIGCAKHALVRPNLSLKERYAIFNKLNTRKRVLKIIKENLLF